MDGSKDGRSRVNGTDETEIEKVITSMLSVLVNSGACTNVLSDDIN
jgi:hypothetical protein